MDEQHLRSFRDETVVAAPGLRLLDELPARSDRCAARERLVQLERQLGAAEGHARTRSGKYGGESRKPMRQRAAGAAARHLHGRADAVRRDEPERARRVVVATAGDEHLAEPSERRRARAPVRVRQQRMVRSSLAVGARSPSRPPPPPARPRASGRLPRGARADRAEEVAVRLLARMRELPLERVDEDRGPAVDDRERVAPQPQRQPEPEVRDEQRVRPLARQVRRRPGMPRQSASSGSPSDARPLLGPAQQRLGVRDRRRPRERRRDRRARRESSAASRRARPRASRRRRARTGEPTSRSTDSSSYG